MPRPPLHAWPEPRCPAFSMTSPLSTDPATQPLPPWACVAGLVQAVMICALLTVLMLA